MDVLRILGSNDLEVRRRTLDFLMSLITLRNVKDVVSLLKKEVIKTYSDSATDIDRELDLFNFLLVLWFLNIVIYSNLSILSILSCINNIGQTYNFMNYVLKRLF